MDVGIWTGLSSLIVSIALAFSGYRTTRVTTYRDHIRDLEKRTEELEKDLAECQADLRRERREKQWLMDDMTSPERSDRPKPPRGTDRRHQQEEE